MSEERKKPTAGFLIAVALVAVLLVAAYPASYGPFLADRFSPYISNETGEIIYRPVGKFVVHAPSWIVDPYIAYLQWWTKHAASFRMLRNRS